MAVTIEGMTEGQRERKSSALRQALWLALAFGLLKYGLQTLGQVVMQHAGYGIFRDELYFIVCGRHLAWGYVDQPPMVPLLTRISELVFGIHSLALFRTFASLAGAAEVALTGVLAWRMGGSRWAQALAMTGVLLAPMVIGIDATISTNMLEPALWTIVALALMELATLAERGVRSGPVVARWWVVMGAAAGLCIENKWTIVFFLVCLLAALLLTEQRKILLSKWSAVGFALIVLIALPNLIWEVHHQWATLQLLHNDQVDGKNVHVGPVAFVLNQVKVLGLLMAPLWIAGVVWLLAGRRAKTFQFLGVTYALFLPLMMILHAKDYYLAAIYPLYFAAGAAAWDGWLKKAWLRRGVVPAYVAANVALTAVVLPAILPVLPPVKEIAYMQRLHLAPPKMETGATATLPQYFADMLDWRHKANLLADAYWSLPAAERKEAVIYAKNYGDASAVNVYRPDVPTAISGHQNYFLWGPRGATGKVMIIFGDSIATDEKEFDSVQVYARDTNPLVEPYERGPILICKGLHGNLETLWPKVKFWY